MNNNSIHRRTSGGGPSGSPLERNQMTKKKMDTIITKANGGFTPFDSDRLSFLAGMQAAARIRTNYRATVTGFSGYGEGHDSQRRAIIGARTRRDMRSVAGR
jgi:hypothetical protein